MIRFPFIFFRVIATFIYHSSASEICLELPFTANLEGLSTFHPSASPVAKLNPSNSLPLSKKDSEIGKSFILAFKYCRMKTTHLFLTSPPESFKIDTFYALPVKVLAIARHTFQAGWILKTTFHLLVTVFFFLCIIPPI